MREEKHIFVTGLVQGVGFRAAVKRHAIVHQITGYVRNLPDGRVEVCAQGTSAHVNSFLKTVQDRPGLGRIDHLDIQEKKPARSYDSFEIL